MYALILSDSHRRPDRVREVLARQLTPPSAVFFLGDGLSDLSPVANELPLWQVCGNCDGFLSPADSAPEEQMVLFGGLRVLLMHGHRYGVKSGLTAALIHAAERDADVLLFGHTHCPYEETLAAGTEIGRTVLNRPLTVCNPGSIGYDGNFAVLTLQKGIPLVSFGTLTT